MPRAYREDVSCIHCGAAIISAGRITCPRCHESVQMYSIQDVVRDEEGRWKCQKCLEHGKRPKTLAVGEEIQCRVCPEKTKNYLFEREAEMTKTAAVKTESGPTKLTTKKYNALLEKWLKDEKKKKKNLENELFVKRGTVYGIKQEDEEALKREISGTDMRIEAIEKAIALNFDPDEFERELNIPINVLAVRQEDLCLVFRADMRWDITLGWQGITK